MWQATNPQARDFRLETIGPAWRSSPVTAENGVYRVSVARPASGYTAFFLELSYPGPSDLPLVFTTEVVVTPNVYPFAAPPMPMGSGRLVNLRSPTEAQRALRKR
jgi:PhoPQ-activated pathogenicity-related protein